MHGLKDNLKIQSFPTTPIIVNNFGDNNITRICVSI